MVACKTVNEYHSNQRKLRRFYLEEQAARTTLSSTCRTNPINTEPLGHEEIVNMARANQRKPARPTKAKQNPKGKPKKAGQKKTTTKADQRRATTFAEKSKEAALKHSQSLRNDKRKLLYSSSSENKSLIKLSPHQLPTLKKFNIRETPGGPTFQIAASSDANDFINTPSTSTAIPGPSQARSTPRVDRIVDNIWERNSPKKNPTDDNPIEVVFLDSSNSEKQTPEVIHLESTPNNETDPNQIGTNEIVDGEIVEGEQMHNNETEEHEGGPPSSISDIHPGDFFDPNEF